MEASGALFSVFFALLLPLICASAGQKQEKESVQEYFIAAVEIGWDYIYLDETEASSDQRKSKYIPQKYIKAVYREYTDSSYTDPKQRDAWTGIQGPTILAQPGETVVVHFKNLASQPYSVSPVGISYSKQSEGAGYDDSTAGREKSDDAVSPGGYYKYLWAISHEDGPTASDPDCLTYTYSSQVDSVRDINSGLIGAIVICRPSAFKEGRTRKYPAFVLLFAVFDETKSWYGEIGERVSREKFKRTQGRKEYHTINGYVNSTLPGLTMCQDRNPVFWHMIGVGTAPEIHSIWFQDHSLEVLTHRKVTLEVTPMTYITAEMRPSTAGRFLISCQINAHRHDGMEASFTVEKCPEPVAPLVPDLRKVKHKDYDDYNDHLYNTKSFGDWNSPLQIRSSRGQQPKTWVHYIAAEEVNWDYAPHLKPTDSELQSRYLPAAPHHLDYTYKKVAYVEYTDETFTQRKDPQPTLLGPLLKGKVKDQFHIIFRNLASRPFNIYPNGLTKIEPQQTSSNAAESDLRSMEVPPNGTFGYIWKLTTQDGPLEGDPTCLTQLYQSSIEPERDLASGLVGTLLICKSDAFDIGGELLGADKKLSLIFAVFDENRSWYFNENMQRSGENSSSTADSDFYDSNVIYSVNGAMFSKRQFVMCQSDVPFWHVANVGTQSDFLSVYFTGNLFRYNDLHQSVLTLFPMTGVTVSMETELIGEWEISAFDSSLKSRGMSIRYTVLPCHNGDLVDHDEEEDISDYYDSFDPRGFANQNRTILVKVCKKVFATNNTHSAKNISADNVTDDRAQFSGTACRLRKVTLPAVEVKEPASEEEIPQDILEGMEMDDEEWGVSQNQSNPEQFQGARRRRQAEGNGTEVDLPSGKYEDGGITMEKVGEPAGNMTDVEVGAKSEAQNEIVRENNGTDLPSGEYEDGRKTMEKVGEPAGNMTDVEAGTKSEAQNEILRENNGTDLPSGEYEDGRKTMKKVGEPAGNMTDVETGTKSEAQNEILRENNGTAGEHQENNEILVNREPAPGQEVSASEESNSEDMEHNFIPQKDLNPEPDHFVDNIFDPEYNFTSATNNATEINLSQEYDDYSEEENRMAFAFGPEYVNVRSGEVRPRHYYIAAEEITWDYGIRTPRQLIKPKEMRRGMRKFLPEYKKVVFRAYLDKDCQGPAGRGEPQEHLGIMGPVIRTEINDLLTVVFKNKASRPYSFHLHGVYDRSQGAGFVQTSSPSAPAGVPGEPVPPGESRTYNWKITEKQGPSESEFDCKTGAYYSTVDKERDLHSGLIGPLVICKSGTLQAHLNTQPDIQEFSLLFHTFDETRSWYMEENLQRHCAPPCQANTEDPWYHTSNMFAAINGYVAETLPGLLVAQHQPVRWHLLNVGSDKEYHAVHFHGLPFTVHRKEQHRMGVYNLFPGVFGTVEMKPPTAGTWLVECIIGDYQLAGMRAKVLVYNPGCAFPLGMKSGGIDDSQITASDYIDDWEPRLARLEQSGYINAWMGRNKNSWLQVDLQKPTLLHSVLTQGVRSKLRAHYITYFTLSYSSDQETWTIYRGNSTRRTCIFHGNMDSSKVKENHLVPPFVARYIRIQPCDYVQKPALRLELLGCDINSCSFPLGLQKNVIPDKNFRASTTHSNLLRTWSPSLARLHQKGSANAWRPRNNNPHEWLQVNLGKVLRITGIITQGAQSLLTKMMVTEFSVSVSHDERSWRSVLEENSQREKIFTGNDDPEDVDKEVLNVFDPPVFAHFIRVHPRGWINGIALRLELLGCDTQQGV